MEPLGAELCIFDCVQIDLRYADPKQGDVIVVVAPVLRFKDVGFNANVTLEDLGQSLLPHPAVRYTHQRHAK